MEKDFKYQRQGAMGTTALVWGANHPQEPEAKLTRFCFFQEDLEDGMREMLKRLWEEMIHCYKKDLAYELSFL